MAHIRVVNGPNLNLLGKREPDHYGHRSLAEIMDQCEQFTSDCGHQFSHLQSNAENELIDAIQSCPDDGVDYIVINPAAFTHTSVALRDTLLAVEIPFVEVHLSNVHAREEFRRQSYFSDIATAVVAGFAGDSYLLAIQGLINRLDPDT